MSGAAAGYRLTPQAESDLLGIAAYIAQDRPSGAKRVLETLRDTFRSLATAPAMGSSCEHLGQGLRKFSPRRPARRYVIFFRRLTGGPRIEIVADLHGSRDVDAVLADR